MADPASDGGFVFLYRSLMEHHVFRNQAEAMTFAWMILRATWKPYTMRYKGRSVPLKRGQFVMSVRDVADAMDRDKAWIERLCARLKRETMIETSNETGVNVITICNYDRYQPSTAARETVGETAGETRVRQSRDTEERKEELQEEDPSEAKASSGRGTRLPANFEPILSGKTAAVVAGWPPGMFDTELDQFRDRHKDKGTISKDWQASFRTWVRNAEKWRHPNGNRTSYNRGDLYRDRMRDPVLDCLARGVDP